MNPIIDDTVQKIKQHTQACWESVKQPALTAPPALSTNSFVQIQKELKQQYPHLSDNELIVKSMNYLKEQFLQSVSTDDDASMRSGTSQPTSETEAEPAEHVLAGESQLPEDDDNTNFGDFWDSLTDVIADKLDKSNRKGKRHD